MNNENILNGKTEAEKMFSALKKQTAKLKIKPSLAVILVGHDPASKVYVGIKEKRAKELGVDFLRYNLSASTTEKKIINLIKKINVDKKITGILLQLPLPKKFNTNKIIQEIDPKKDVDGLLHASCCHPELVSGSLKRCRNKFGMTKCVIPPTIQSIIHLIKLSKQKLVNKKAVILCHSQKFAESLKLELFQQKISADILIKPNIKTHNSLFLIPYSIIIITLGQKHFLKSNMVKKNAVIIDVGINKVGKKIFGDVDAECLEKTKYISPVPGGVGPLTVAYLFKNLIKLSKAK